MIRLSWSGVSWNLCAWALCCIAYLAFAGHAAFYSLPPDISKLAPISLYCIPVYGSGIYLASKFIFISFSKARILRREKSGG